MGPARASPGLAPGSPRPGGSSARPTSELLGGAGMFQTPEGVFQHSPISYHLSILSSAEALDQWFENLQNYEATLVSALDSSRQDRKLITIAGRNGCCFIGR